MSVDIIHGDCLSTFKDVRGLASIVSDPPSGTSFMQLGFDSAKGGRDKWIPYFAERFKVAREATERGAYGLFWGFGKTAHWTACALDDAGWEYIRPIGHLHGQGWPKAQSQLKPAWEIWHLVRWGTGGVQDLQIDRCRVRRSAPLQAHNGTDKGYGGKRPYTPGDAGKILQDAGSWPPDFLATHCPACREVGSRKVRSGARPNCTGRDYGHENMRIGGSLEPCTYKALPSNPDGTETVPAWSCLAACTCGLASLSPAGGAPERCPGCGEERWWACPVAELDGQSGETTSGSGIKGKRTQKSTYGTPTQDLTTEWEGDSGGASRFFPTFHYDAKASARERQAGCEGLLWVKDKAAPIGWRRVTRAEYDAAPAFVPKKKGEPEANRATGNVHATIKPVGAGEEDGLMRWLVRLITPPGGNVGDITLGSGSTAVACQIEGHDFTGCDIDPGAVDIARARTAFWTPERHRLELRNAAALRAEEKRQEAAAARGQLDIFARSA